MSVESASSSNPAPSSQTAPPLPFFMNPEKLYDLAKMFLVPIVVGLFAFWGGYLLLTRDNAETREKIKQFQEIKEQRSVEIALLKSDQEQLRQNQERLRGDQGEIKKEFLGEVKDLNSRMTRFEDNINSIMRAVGVVEGQNSRTGGSR